MLGQQHKRWPIIKQTLFQYYTPSLHGLNGFNRKNVSMVICVVISNKGFMFLIFLSQALITLCSGVEPLLLSLELHSSGLVAVHSCDTIHPHKKTQ